MFGAWSWSLSLFFSPRPQTSTVWCKKSSHVKLATRFPESRFRLCGWQIVREKKWRGGIKMWCRRQSQDGVIFERGVEVPFFLLSAAWNSTGVKSLDMKQTNYASSASRSLCEVSRSCRKHGEGKIDSEKLADVIRSREAVMFDRRSRSDFLSDMVRPWNAPEWWGRNEGGIDCNFRFDMFLCAESDVTSVDMVLTLRCTAMWTLMVHVCGAEFR
jgi:hypothetical protein